MSEEKLNFFLEIVQADDLDAYLGRFAEHSDEGLIARLEWATLYSDHPRHAQEARFLVSHGDAIAARLGGRAPGESYVDVRPGAVAYEEQITDLDIPPGAETAELGVLVAWDEEEAWDDAPSGRRMLEPERSVPTLAPRAPARAVNPRADTSSPSIARYPALIGAVLLCVVGVGVLFADAQPAHEVHPIAAAQELRPAVAVTAATASPHPVASADAFATRPQVANDPLATTGPQAGPGEVVTAAHPVATPKPQTTVRPRAASALAAPPPPVSAPEIADILGTWTGTDGVGDLTLAIERHEGAVIFGTVTVIIDGAPRTLDVWGRYAAADGSLELDQLGGSARLTGRLKPGSASGVLSGADAAGARIWSAALGPPAG